MNGASTFFRALRTQEIDYHTFYPTLPHDEAFRIMRLYLGRMGGTLASPDPESLVRRFPANPAGLGKLNVVILSEESLGAQYVGIYGNDRSLTPVIDQLASEGLLFWNAYATGTRTVRGLEAMTASFPPIPSESIIKRPGSESVSNWGEIMRQHGYHASFLYGGYGAFDNMNHFFGSNGFALSDRLDIDHPKFTNAWGVSDEDLFHHAVAYYDEVAQSGAPFFSLIMTTSNHKPFTFPPGIPGVPEEGGARDAGVRYADYAIGKFFEEARQRPWFSNTIFVVIADHDSRVYGEAEVPVEHYRIPVLLYSPGHIAPAVSEKTFSNMDLAPTVLGLLGLAYEAPFYGVNVLDPKVPDSRPVLFSHNHDVAIYERDRLSVLGLHKTARSFSYADGHTAEVAQNRGMIALLTAHLQTAYELFQAKKY
jgi:phosphoglycerol transferase MdoB-like AlkP superfamily enzyme